MGTIINDSVLNKIRERQGFCAYCGEPCAICLSQAEARVQTDPHDYVEAGNEPIFVFRAQDVAAVIAVQYWMNHVVNKDLPPEKREEAAQWCSTALQWPKKKRAD